MDRDRRKFLKIIFIGSGALLAERALGSLYSRFFSDSSAKNPARTNLLKADSLDGINNNSGGFRIVRNNEGLSIYDSAGEEIFQIDNNG